jgi:hypothetical protein
MGTESELKLRTEFWSYMSQCEEKGHTEEDIKKLRVMIEELIAYNPIYRKYYRDLVYLKGTLPPGVFI